VRILALIPARGGSKRLSGKNIRELDGRPLTAWSIDVAKGVPDICDILVSTDESTTAGIARNTGAMVPWLRPVELATDMASSVLCKELGRVHRAPGESLPNIHTENKAICPI
jgi:CMP-N,N'-diacetyllegionaminic acid synthase